MTMFRGLYRDVKTLEREVRQLKVRSEPVMGGASGGSGVAGSPLGVTLWENQSGGTRSQGYVVVASGDRIFDDTTTIGDPRAIGVLDDDAVQVGANGRVRHFGYQSVVNVQGAVVAFNYLRSSATAGNAEDAGGVQTAGVFAIALTAFAGPGAGTVAAYVMAAPMDSSIHVQTYLRVGAVTPPTNVTAGDLTVVRINVGDVAFGAGVEAAVGGDATVSGWMRVGSGTPPTNVTAGDVTAVRAHVGDDDAFAGGNLLRVVETALDPAGNNTAAVITVTTAPTGGAATNRIGLDVQIAAVPSAADGGRHIAMNFFASHLSGAFDLTGASALVGMQGGITQAVGATTIGTASAARYSATVSAGSVTNLFMVDSRVTLTGGNTIGTLDHFHIVINSFPTTLTTHRGVNIPNLGNAAVGTAVGIDVAAQSGAATNIGLRNAGTTVWTPASQTLAAAGNAITADATYKEIDNSTGASLTLTSTPTIANGQAGQVLILVNKDGADDVVLQDESVLGGSNLRLAGAANLTLGPRDSVTLIFSSALGDWIEIARSNN